MEIQPKPPTVKGPAELHRRRLVRRDRARRGAVAVRVNLVRFAPGARNAWHAHAVGQALHVTEGLGRIQARGGEVLAIRAGDTIHTPPGEWHWHGAAPDHFMTHLTIWEAPADGPESEWGAQVTDAEYGAQISAATGPCASWLAQRAWMVGGRRTRVVPNRTEMRPRLSGSPDSGDRMGRLVARS